MVHASLRRIIQPPLGIHDLPPELLPEIASHLDFIDVILLGQTTQTLRKATEAHAVWYSLAKKYVARHFDIPRPENGTVDSLKTRELREWIWHRLVVDQIWRKNNTTPTSKRSIDMQEETRRLSLIPGGRWLLTFRAAGFIDCYDLDSKEPSLKLLSEPGPGDSSDLGPVAVALSMNNEAPVLEFTLAVSSLGSKFYENPHTGWLHIRKVNLVGEGPSASLQAHKLTSIPHTRYDSFVCVVGLSGNLVARKIVEGLKVWIEIFRWTECSSYQLMTSSIRIENGLQGRLDNGIHFIGEDRVLCTTRNHILLYKIPPLAPLLVDCEHKIGYQSEEDVTEPSWTYSQKRLHLTTPPSISFDGIGYRLVIQDSQAVVGIHIPPSLDEHPSIRFQIPLAFPILLSLFKGYALHEGGSATRVCFGWGSDTSENCIKEPDRGSSLIPETLFDAETGRCIIIRENLEKVEVVDFLF